MTCVARQTELQEIERALDARHRMRVAPQEDLQRVADLGRAPSRVVAGSERPGGVRMPPAVKLEGRDPRVLFDRSTASPGPVARKAVVRPGLALGIPEHTAGASIRCPALEHFRCLPHQIDLANLVGLRGLVLPAGLRLPDRCAASLQVHVGPLQGDDLAAPATRLGRKQNGIAKPIRSLIGGANQDVRLSLAPRLDSPPGFRAGRSDPAEDRPHPLRCGRAQRRAMVGVAFRDRPLQDRVENRTRGLDGLPCVVSLIDPVGGAAPDQIFIDSPDVLVSPEGDQAVVNHAMLRNPGTGRHGGDHGVPPRFGNHVERGRPAGVEDDLALPLFFKLGIEVGRHCAGPLLALLDAPAPALRADPVVNEPCASVPSVAYGCRHGCQTTAAAPKVAPNGTHLCYREQIQSEGFRMNLAGFDWWAIGDLNAGLPPCERGPRISVYCIKYRKFAQSGLPR